MRAGELTSRNFLAQYDDSLYNNFGLLAFETPSEKRIEDLFKAYFNGFHTPYNVYTLEAIEVEYSPVSIYSLEALNNQLQSIVKYTLGEELLESLIFRLKNHKKVQAYYNKMYKKIEGSRFYKKVKTQRRKLLKRLSTIQLNDELYHAFQSLETVQRKYIEEIEMKMEALRSLEPENQEVGWKGYSRVMEDFHQEKDDLQQQIVCLKKINKVSEEIKALEKSITNRLHKLKVLRRLNDEADKRRIESLEKKIKREKKELGKIKISLTDTIKRYKKEQLALKSNDLLINRLEKLRKPFGQLLPEDYGGVIEENSAFLKKIQLTEPLAMDFDATFLLNEYILGCFKSPVESDVRNFKFFNVSERSAATVSEIEYIMEGNLSSEVNHLAINSKLLMVREIFNFFHLAIDSDKREFIYQLAEVPAIGGAVATGVTFAWVTSESCVDLYTLHQGKGMPFIKIQDNHWVIDQDILLGRREFEGGNLESQESFMFYHDYCRMFLMNFFKPMVFVTNREKLERLLYLIYLNYKDENPARVFDRLALAHSISITCKVKSKLSSKSRTIQVRLKRGYLDEE